MLCVSLGGLCETKYQIQRLNLPTISSVFDWNITPTTSLVQILAAGIPSDLFAWENLEECSPWGTESRQIQDKRYKIRNVHDFTLDKTIKECYDTFQSKLVHLIENTRKAFEEDNLILFHKITQEHWQKDAGLVHIMEILANIWEIRDGKKFCLVIIDKFGLPPFESGNLLWISEPMQKEYVWEGNPETWRTIVEKLGEGGIL